VGTLAAQIEELCEGQLGRFDYQPEGLDFYETDEWGIAILEDDYGPKSN
jgi:hypothetical protein